MNKKSICILGLTVLVSLITFPILDSFAVLKTVDLIGEDKSEWELVDPNGTAINKQTAVSDGDSSTGIKSGVNNQIQTFLADVPLNANIHIDSVTLYAEFEKFVESDGTTFEGTSKFRFIILGATNEFLDESTFTATSSPGEKTYDINPLTGQAWKVSDFDTTSFGVIQETDNKDILVKQFEVRLDIDDVPPTITVPDNFENVEGNASNGAKLSFEVTAMDNISSPENISIECDTDVGNIQSSPYNGNNVLFSYVPPTTPILPSIHDTTTTVTCIATDEAGNISDPGLFLVSVIDIKEPNVTLIGDNPHLQLKAELLDNFIDCPAYVDLGASIVDIVDQNPTLNIVNNVDLCIVSEYTNDYVGNDATGNTNTINRYINVVDFFVGDNLPQINLGTSHILELDDFGHLAVGSERQVITLQSVEKYGTSTESVRDTLQVTLLEDFVDVDGVLIPSGLFLSDELTFNTILDDNADLIVAEGDVIVGHYKSLTKKLTNIASVDSAGRAGVQPNQNDPIRFFESEVYVPGQSATVIVQDYAGDNGVLSINVDLTSSLGSISIPALRAADGDDFITDPYFTFIDAGINGGHSLLVNPTLPNGDTITASTAGIIDTATAHVIPDLPTTILPAVYEPELNRTDCVGTDNDADAICNDWEDDNAIGLDVFVDVDNTVDSDGDGINNNDRDQVYQMGCTPGVTYITDPTGESVCPNVNIKDFYLEIDYMQFHKPSDAAIEAYVQAFVNSNAIGTGGAINGIQAHVIVDEELPHSDNMGFGAPSALGGPDFFDLKLSHFGTPSERTGTSDEINDRLNAKRQVFHYAIFGHNNDEGGSGIGEVGGNDFAITLGDFPGHIGTTGQIAATMLHESGHNMGLRHGGPDSPFTDDDSRNCKPNYPSVMNYLYQFDVLDGGLLNRPLDLSRWAYSIINEGRLYDSQRITGNPALEYMIGGINGPHVAQNGVAIDWDNDGVFDGNQQYGVNQFDDIPGCQSADDDFDGVGGADFSILRSYKDWTSINLNFRDQGPYDNGVVRIAPPTATPIEFPPGAQVEPDNVRPVLEITDANGVPIVGPVNLTLGDIWFPASIVDVNPHTHELTVVLDPMDGTGNVTTPPTIIVGEDPLVFEDYTWNVVGNFELTITAVNEFNDNNCGLEGCAAIEVIEVHVTTPDYDNPVQTDSPIDNSVYKIKRTLPIKFQVTIDDVPTQTLTPPLIFTQQGDAEPLPATSKTGKYFENEASFDPSRTSYSYSLDTKDLYPGDLNLQIVLDDGDITTIKLTLR